MMRTSYLAVALAFAGTAALAQQGAPGPAPADQAAAARQRDAVPDSSGTGPFAAMKRADPALPDHVIYQPRNLDALGKKKLGVVVWGNGGCAPDGASARHHLLELASYGYVVVAPGRILSGPGAPPRTGPGRRPDAGGSLPPAATTAADVTRGLDWALAENARSGSPLKGRIDPAKVAVAGHSCGGLQALQVAEDPRIRAVIVHNSGIFADGSNPIPGINVNKALLGRLHTPVLYVLGGEGDVAWPNGTDDFKRIDHVPAALVWADVGHGGTFGELNGGRVGRISVDWLEWQLSGDAKAGKTFVGTDCGLCTDPQWKIERKRIG
jgi:dienelactone hydrolase